jgi:hypothetical protein
LSAFWFHCKELSIPQSTKKKLTGKISSSPVVIEIGAALCSSAFTQAEIESDLDLSSLLAYRSHSALVVAEKQFSLHIGSPVISEIGILG